MSRGGIFEGQILQASIATGNILLAFFIISQQLALSTEEVDSGVCQAATSTGTCHSFMQKVGTKDHVVVSTGDMAQQSAPGDEAGENAVLQSTVSVRLDSKCSRTLHRAPKQVALPAVHHAKPSKSQSPQKMEFSHALDSLLAAVQYEAEVLDIPMPMVLHRKVGRNAPVVAIAKPTTNSFWRLTGFILLDLLILLAVMLCCCICCLQYHKPSNDRMIKHKPNLSPFHEDEADEAPLFHSAPNPTMQTIGSPVSQSFGTPSYTQTLFQNKLREVDGKRVLIVRALAGSTLKTWSENVFQYQDESTSRAVLQANVTISERVTWYQRWYWQARFDGLGNVVGATPVGQLFGVAAREHPAISMFSLMKEDVGPCFLACRMQENANQGRTFYFYDKDDKFFAVLTQDTMDSSRYKLESSSLQEIYKCQQLLFERQGNSHYVTVSTSRSENVARTEPCAGTALANPPGNVINPAQEFYKIIFDSEVRWMICCLVLESLIAIEIDSGLKALVAK